MSANISKSLLKIQSTYIDSYM